MSLRSTAIQAVSGTLFHTGLLGPVTRAVAYTSALQPTLEVASVPSELAATPK